MAANSNRTDGGGSRNFLPASPYKKMLHRHSPQSSAPAGSEMIVWGGLGEFGIFNNGSRYDPTADTWTTTSTVNAYDGR
jgi:hypothetical protein